VELADSVYKIARIDPFIIRIDPDTDTILIEQSFLSARAAARSVAPSAACRRCAQLFGRRVAPENLAVMFAVTDDQLRTIASRLLSQTAVSTASPTTSRRRHPHPNRDSNRHSKGDGADPNRHHNHHRSRHPNRHSTNPHHNRHPNHNRHPKP
jgi:hypothetical protein